MIRTLCEAIEQLAPPFPETDADPVRERLGEMRLVGKASLNRNLGQGHLSASHALLSNVDAPLQQPPMRRNPCRGAERSRKMAHGEAALGGEVFNRHCPIEMGVHYRRG